MKEISCKNGSFYVDNRTLSFLRIYKGGEVDSDLEEIFPDSPLAFFAGTSLDFSNINRFMNFLENPRGVELKGLYVDHLDEMVDMVKSLVDLSCEYALNNGNVDRVVYRYEDMRNLKGYQNGYLTSLKSTSDKARTIAFTFGSDYTNPFLYKVNGFCPYMEVEKILGECNFSNEDEYIFPPFIKCELTDEYEEDYNKTDYYRVVNIKDDYEDGDYDLDSLSSAFESVKDRFEVKFGEDKENGAVSDELCELSSHIRNYLKGYSRNKYKEYYELYKRKYKSSLESIDTYWGEEYVGFEDALVKYFSNTDSDKSWYGNDTVHVLVFSELVESGFIPNDLLGTMFSSDSPSVVEDFLKNRNDGFRSLSDSEYKTFISNFNVLCNRNEILQTRINLANKMVCDDYTDGKNSIK
ncbi:MAG: hypothetical protein E7162_01335 [Firmicutes bacterium]|nr:hypothetical protein [Bacillota bacterium]